MKKNTLKAAIATVVGVTAITATMSANAFTLNNGDVLTIDTGSPTFDAVYGVQNNVTSGSFFGMDFNGDSKVQGTEKTIINTGPGITIGSATAVPSSTTGYHTGPRVAGDGGPVDGAWDFNSATGTHWLNTTAVTGDTTNGLNFGGWTVAWSTISNIPMTSGAWTPLNCALIGCNAGATFANATADFAWDGVYGNAYQIDYTATVPAGDPSGFGGTQYFLRLTGTVNPVPVPAAVWLFGSGLLGLVAVARRKKSV